MKRVLHRDFMRGHVAQRAAILLAIGLVMVLVLSVAQGVRTLIS